MKFVGNHIEITPPKHPKKITGTRFASILGKNAWNTPFQTWCEITRTYMKPYEETIYTTAGKTIEPIQIAYMEKSYLMDNLRSPGDVFGKDFFKKTFGDFFHENEIFGGMWDSILVDTHGKPSAVLEFKTTKRAEDWAEDVPEYYAMQAALYAWLLGVDTVIMVPSFLSPEDYKHPENFVPSVNNTSPVEFKVSERYPNFAELVKAATDWWETYVVGGKSPDFDEVKDKEYLAALRTAKPDANTIQKVVNRAEELQSRAEARKDSTKAEEAELKDLVDSIKTFLIENMGADDATGIVSGKNHIWQVTKSVTETIDKEAMKRDGVLGKYTTLKTSYKITCKGE